MDLFIEEERAIFIYAFQEKKPPYITRAVELAEDVIRIGQDKYKEALNIYKENSEKYKNTKWSSGYDSVELIQVDDLPNKIFYSCLPYSRKFNNHSALAKPHFCKKSTYTGAF